MNTTSYVVACHIPVKFIADIVEQKPICSIMVGGKEIYRGMGYIENDILYIYRTETDEQFDCCGCCEDGGCSSGPPTN